MPTRCTWRRLMWERRSRGRWSAGSWPIFHRRTYRTGWCWCCAIWNPRRCEGSSLKPCCCVPRCECHLCFARTAHPSASFLFQKSWISVFLVDWFPVKGSQEGWSLWTLQRGHRQENRSLWRDMRTANPMTNSTQRRRCGRNYRYVSVRLVCSFPLKPTILYLSCIIAYWNKSSQPFIHLDYIYFLSPGGPEDLRWVCSSVER